MGLLTFERFRTRLESGTGNLGFDDATLGEHVNAGYLELCNIAEFEELNLCATINVTEGVRLYSLPDRLMGVQAVRLDDKPLERMGRYSFTRANKDKKGRPKKYFRRANAIYFWPNPDKAYEVFALYAAEPEPLVDDGDVTILPSVYDYAIVLLAHRSAFLERGESSKATLFYQSAMNYINMQTSFREHEMDAHKEGVFIPNSEEDLREHR